MTQQKIFDFKQYQQAYSNATFIIHNIDNYSIEILFNQIILINKEGNEIIIDKFDKYILKFNKKYNHLVIYPNPKKVKKCLLGEKYIEI